MVPRRNTVRGGGITGDEVDMLSEKWNLTGTAVHAVTINGLHGLLAFAVDISHKRPLPRRYQHHGRK